MDSTAKLAWHKPLMTETDDRKRGDRTRAAGFEMGCELVKYSLKAMHDWSQKPATSKSIECVAARAIEYP